LLIYLRNQIQQLNLQENQKLVWLIDCWSVHKSKQFVIYIKGHPNILVVFVPTNCTSELQPVNVMIQRPLKQAFKVNFNKWIVNIMKHQICEGKELHIDLKMSNLNLKFMGGFMQLGHKSKERRK